MVVIAIIALLVSILLPSLKMAKDLAKQAACSVQLRSGTMAVVIWENENGHIPFIYDGDAIPWTTHVASAADWPDTVLPNNDLYGMCDLTGPYRQCPADEESHIGMNYYVLNSPDQNTMVAPLIYKEYYGITSIPITFEAIHEPATWLMLADTWDPYGYASIWAYTPIDFKFNVDYDNDGMLDSYSMDIPYDEFKPRNHPSVPVSLCDGHVEAVDFESLWETNASGIVVHDFWWEKDCSYPRE